ncbi:MAG: hypothetical protein NTX02_13350, partial [Planctomycetia bacterium]|nr:hypothetical protein [Planctomycetia bacterium]
MATGKISGNNGVITATNLSIRAQNTSAINASVSNLSANITGNAQSLTITEADNLTINASSILTNNGDVTINVVTGNLTLTGNINAKSAGNVWLNTPVGSVVGVGNRITANVLNVTANTTSTLNTSVTSLTANISQANNNLTVEETDDLSITANNVRTSNGDIQINLASGNLTLTGGINAGILGNVTLNTSAGYINGAGLVTGQFLTVNATNNSSLTTNVANLTATVTGLNKQLIINESTDLFLESSGISTNNGAVTLNLTTGNLSGTGGINTVLAGNITLNVPLGNISPAGIVTGNILNVTAQNSSVLSTNVASLRAKITGSGESLTVLETNDLLVYTGNVTTTSGNIVINIATGNLSGTGSINAVGGNISLNTILGNITLNTSSNQIFGNVLAVTALDNSSLKTHVQGFESNVTSNGNSALTVVEADDLTLWENGVVTNNSALSITLLSGNLASGFIKDFTLVNGGVNYTSAPLVSITGGGGTGATAVATIAGSSVNAVIVTNAGTGYTSIPTVTISPDPLFPVGTGADFTANIVSGKINAGTGNITLSAASGNVTLNGAISQISGNILNLTAANSSSLNTSVLSLVANITGALSGLVIQETNDLQIGTGNVVTTSGDITIQLATGNLTGTGSVKAPNANLSLNVSLGNITLNSTASQIVGNVLEVKAQNTSNLNTSISTLNASVTNLGDSFTISEATDLAIGLNNVTTTNGLLSINLATGNLSGSGNISTGTGNVSLNASAGSVALNVSLDQVSGNVLTLVAKNSSSLNTNVSNLIASVTNASGGSLTISESNGLTINALDNVTTTNGPISIDVGTGGAGDLNLSGNLSAGGASNITLNVSNGLIIGTGNLTAGTLGVGNLDWTAINQPSVLNQANWIYSGLTAAVTGPGNSIAIDRSTNSNLTVFGLKTHSGTIDVKLSGTKGSLNLAGPVTAGYSVPGGTSDVTLNVTNGSIFGTGLITGNVLNVTALSGASLLSNVTSLIANITDAGNVAGLSVSEYDSLEVPLSSNVATANGPISLIVGTSGTGSLNILGNILAGPGNLGDVTLNGANGIITGSGIVAAGNLTWVAQSQPSDSTWLYNNVSGNVTGIGNDIVLTRTVTTGVNSLTTKSGNITVTINGTGNATPAVANLVLNGNVTAGPNNSGNVTLNVANGSISTTGGSIYGGNLVIDSLHNANVSTSVDQLVATIGGAGNSLTVLENSSLSIGSANVITNNGAITINLASGNLSALGQINAGTGNVTLNATAGGIDINSSMSYDQIVGNQFIVLAQNSTSLRTKVNSLQAKISGSGESLLVAEYDGVSVSSGNVATSNGDITIVTGLQAAGDLVLTGNVTSGNASTTLSSINGGISGVGLITASLLDVQSLNDAVVHTIVSSVSANITGVQKSFTINEADDLTIDAADILTNNGNITLNLASGGLTAVGTITGNILNITANTSSSLTTDVTSLVANIQDNLASFTINEADNLTIGSGSVVTNNGATSINLATGSLTVTGAINAG